MADKQRLYLWKKGLSKRFYMLKIRVRKVERSVRESYFSFSQDTHHSLHSSTNTCVSSSLEGGKVFCAFGIWVFTYAICVSPPPPPNSACRLECRCFSRGFYEMFRGTFPLSSCQKMLLKRDNWYISVARTNYIFYV